MPLKGLTRYIGRLILKYLYFKQSDENRKLLSKKYEAISQKLIVLVHNDGKDLMLSYLNLRNCDCFWNNISGRIDMYLDKVNEKFGLPVLEVVRNLYRCLLRQRYHV